MVSNFVYLKMQHKQCRCLIQIQALEIFRSAGLTYRHRKIAPLPENCSKNIFKHFEEKAKVFCLMLIKKGPNFKKLRALSCLNLVQIFIYGECVKFDENFISNLITNLKISHLIHQMYVYNHTLYFFLTECLVEVCLHKFQGNNPTIWTRQRVMFQKDLHQIYTESCLLILSYLILQTLL